MFWQKVCQLVWILFDASSWSCYAIQLTPTDEELDTDVGFALRTCNCHTIAKGRVGYS